MSDRLDLRTIKLLQLANELTRKCSNPAMDEAYSRIRLAILSDGLPTNQRDLRSLEREINAIFIDVTNKYFSDMTDELYKLSALEATFAASITKEAIKREGLAVKISETAKQKVDRYVKGSVMHLHSKYSDFVGTYEEALSDMIDGQSKRVKAIIKGAWLQQSNGTMPSPNSVISQVKAVSDIKGKQVAESLVRTAVNHFSTQGRLAFRDDNIDVIEREVPIVTFDSRVSDTCLSIAARFGQRGWPVGQSPVGYPPYHPNCRTAIGFLAQGQKELYGTRQAIGGQKGKVAEEEFEARKSRTDRVVKYRGKKDSGYFKAGQIPANKPVAAWLNEQPPWFIEEVLGKKKAQAFMGGDLNLAKIVDKNLKPLTLEQIGIE